MYHASLPYALRAASIALSMCSLSEPSHITCVLPPCFLLSDQSTSSVPSHACPDFRSIIVRIQGLVTNRSGVVGDKIHLLDKAHFLTLHPTPAPTKTSANTPACLHSYRVPTISPPAHVCPPALACAPVPVQHAHG